MKLDFITMDDRPKLYLSDTCTVPKESVIEIVFNVYAILA